MAVERFKKGKTYYFDIIYSICLRKLEYSARKIDFSNMKYNKDDFLQDAIIQIFNYLIDKHDPKRAKFSTLLFIKTNSFARTFLKANRRREILIDCNFTEEDVNELLENLKEVRKMPTSFKEADYRISLSDDIKKLYSALNREEKKVFKRMLKRKNMNNTKDSQIIMAYKCGMKYRKLRYVINSIEDKYKLIREER